MSHLRYTLKSHPTSLGILFPKSPPYTKAYSERHDGIMRSIASILLQVLNDAHTHLRRAK